MYNLQLNLRRRDLRVINISNYNFIGKNLEGVNLRRKNLAGKNLEGAKLIDANLEKANLKKANLTRTTSTRAKFTDANLAEAILEEAYLLNANLERANLERANLKKAYLSSATLEKAILIEANLEEANLTRANLKGAILERANLEKANLIGADLRKANLREANLRGADLTGADLRGADLIGVILSKIQEKQIIRDPEYITINQGNLVGRPRNLAIPVSVRSFAQRRQNLFGSLFIPIPEEFLKLQSSANDLCPNYNDLYDFILDELDRLGKGFILDQLDQLDKEPEKDFSRMIQFKYIGQPVIDAGGAKRDIFEKLLPIYTHRFFKSIKSNNECLILKNDIDMEIFTEETLKMIFLAKSAGTSVFLKIDPRLFPLLSDKKYFNNSKKADFKVLYEAVNYYANSNNNQYNVLTKNTNNTFVRNRKINKNRNDIILRYKQEKNEDMRNKLRKEIRLRKFLVEFGFTTWKQFENMCDFFKNIIEIRKKILSFKLDFDLESFLKKIRIRKVPEEAIPLIPLTNFGELSDDKTTFQFKESDIYGEYEYFHPFLNYILGPESTDKRRALCIAYVTGSSYYPGSFTFVLQSEHNPKPFEAHTCIFECFFFKNHRNRTNPFQTKEEFIEDQLKPNSGSNFSIA